MTPTTNTPVMGKQVDGIQWKGGAGEIGTAYRHDDGDLIVFLHPMGDGWTAAVTHPDRPFRSYDFLGVDEEQALVEASKVVRAVISTPEEP